MKTFLLALSFNLVVFQTIVAQPPGAMQPVNRIHSQQMMQMNQNRMFNLMNSLRGRSSMATSEKYEFKIVLKNDSILTSKTRINIDLSLRWSNLVRQRTCE